jgi:hypothetical protein
MNRKSQTRAVPSSLAVTTRAPSELAGVAGANSPIELAATGSELVHQVTGERLATSGTLVRE